MNFKPSEVVLKNLLLSTQKVVIENVNEPAIILHRILEKIKNKDIL